MSDGLIPDYLAAQRGKSAQHSKWSDAERGRMIIDLSVPSSPSLRASSAAGGKRFNGLAISGTLH